MTDSKEPWCVSNAYGCDALAVVCSGECACRMGQPQRSRAHLSVAADQVGRLVINGPCLRRAFMLRPVPTLSQ